jgi:hypothetical protein
MRAGISQAIDLALARDRQADRRLVHRERQ